MILGTITSVTNGGVRVKIDGEDEQTEKRYLILTSYTPAVGNRVLIEEVGGQYVILGRVGATPAAAGPAHYVVPYSGGTNLEFTVFNGNLWVRQGSTQWALAKG